MSPLDLTFLSDLTLVIQPNALLSDFTTFALGGCCRCVINVQTPKELETVIKRLVERNISFILIGGGSNLLVSDEGVDCVVVRYISLPLIERQGNDVIVSGSTLLDDLAKFAVKNTLEGLNCTTGIPGTVGGAIIGNAGAFGKQVGDILEWVELLDKAGHKRKAKPESLGFRYRHSHLKESGEIVVSAKFRLKPADRTALEKEREEILAIRHEKHPDLKVYPSAGSFFRNIEPTSKAERRQAAGWFLEQAGAKQMRVGGAAVFEKHANIIVKSNNCRSQNVFELSNLMAKAVKEKFGLSLVREVRLIGKFEGMPTGIRSYIW